VIATGSPAPEPIILLATQLSAQALERPMAVHSVHHFNLRAPATELLALRDFYRDVLGFAEGPRPPFRSKGYWLYVDGAPLLHLTEVSKQETTSPLGARTSRLR